MWSDLRMSSRKKGTEKEEGKEKPDWVDALENRLVSVMENQNALLMKRMADMEKKMNERIDEIKVELSNTSERIKNVEQKTSDIETELRMENKKLQDQIMLTECKLMENYIRIRGMPESETDLREEMVNIISEFVELPMKEIERELDVVYRVNSEFARKKNLPRDIIVKVLTHKMRDLIFTRQFKEPMEVKGKYIKIWKELPRDLIKQRREFKQLVDRLRQEQVKYRWEIPCGLSFLYKKKRWMIKSFEQMQEFLKTAKEGSEEGQTSQENQNGAQLH